MRYPTFKRMCALLLALVGVLSFGSAALAAGGRGASEELRFMPRRSLGLIHLNDGRATVDEIMAIIGKMGFSNQVNKELRRTWRRMHRDLKTNSPAKTWGDFFAQLGLDPRPSATVVLVAAPKTKVKFGFLAAIRIGKSKNFVRLLSRMSRDIFRSQVFMCSYRCRSAVSRMQLKGKGGSPSIKDLVRANPSFANRCPHMIQHFQKQGQIDCLNSYSARKKYIAQNAGYVGRKKFRKAWLYDFPGLHQVSVAVTGSYALIASNTGMLKRALRRYASKKPHPQAAVFARRSKRDTHIQFSMDYGPLMRLANSQNSRMYRRNPILRRMPLFRQLEQISNRLSRGFGRTYMELHGGRNGFRATMKMMVNANQSIMVRKIMKLAPIHFSTLRYVPRNAVFVMSMNYIQTYFDLFNIFASKMSGGFPFKAIVGPWQQILGREMTLAASATSRRNMQLIAAVSLRQPKQFMNQVNRLQQALGQKQGLFQVTKSNGLTIMHRLIRPGRRRRSPIPFPVQVAFTVTGKHLLFVARVAPKPNLRVIKRLAAGKMGRSISKNTVFARQMKRVGKTNFLGFVSFTQALKIARMFAPPIQRIQQMIQNLSVLKYTFFHGRRSRDKRAQIAYGILKLGK